jgi:hypothetical protein
MKSPYREILSTIDDVQSAGIRVEQTDVTFDHLNNERSLDCSEGGDAEMEILIEEQDQDSPGQLQEVNTPLILPQSGSVSPARALSPRHKTPTRIS